VDATRDNIVQIICNIFDLKLASSAMKSMLRMHDQWMEWVNAEEHHTLKCHCFLWQEEIIHVKSSLLCGKSDPFAEESAAKMRAPQQANTRTANDSIVFKCKNP
jgi:hypothetical protein